MLKIEKTVLPSPEQWEIIIEGMRNPKNSWDRMDSDYRKVASRMCDECGKYELDDESDACEGCELNYIDCSHFLLGPNDHHLMDQLNEGGPVHAKYRRMINVYVTLTAPFYWWKEFDTYKIGTVCNSCSTMHKIHAKEFELFDFSFEKLIGRSDFCWENGIMAGSECRSTPLDILEETIHALNVYREKFLETKDKKYWHQMIQLLPTSYNQKRTIMLNYEVLVGIYKWRRNHKLDEWHTFCGWIEGLPYSELITGEG